MNADTIHLKDVRLFSHVGVFPEEKENGQYFVFDIDLLFDEPILGVESDLLTDSVSYADVYDTLKDIVEAAHFDLIERLAGVIADELLENYPCSKVRVTVKKPDAPIDGQFAYMGVTIFREKEKPSEGAIAYIGVGANLGDRENTLIAALDGLNRHRSVDLVAVSSLYETSPWGVTDQPDFLNAVAKIRTSLDPFALLRLLQAIEQRHGRVRIRHWGERTLDLDILELEDVKIDSATLTVPHPRIKERPFVLIPLAEVKGEETGLDPSVKRIKDHWYCSGRVDKVE